MMLIFMLMHVAVLVNFCFTLPICCENSSKNIEISLSLRCKMTFCESGANIAGSICVTCIPTEGIRHSSLWSQLVLLCNQKEILHPLSLTTRNLSTSFICTHFDLANQMTVDVLDQEEFQLTAVVPNTLFINQMLNSSQKDFKITEFLLKEDSSAVWNTTKAIEMERLPLSGVPYYYILPSGFVLLIMLVVLIHKTSCKKKAVKQGFPSGAADVEEEILPFLVPPDRVHLQELIGEGAFAVVHRAILMSPSRTVAAKVFTGCCETRRRALLREVRLLRLLGRNDHVVQLVGFSLDVTRLLLLLDYCPGGNLRIHLSTLKKQLMHMKSTSSSEENCYGSQLCSYIHQVARAMAHVSSLKIVHRDVAARNVLLKADLRRAVLGDFGLARNISERGVYVEGAPPPLPLRWMAPEAIETHTFDTSTDVWCFGVFMWEVFRLGKEPYPGLPTNRLLRFLKDGHRLDKPHCTQHWYSLMLECWRAVPQHRPRFQELVQRTGDLLETVSHYVTLT